MTVCCFIGVALDMSKNGFEMKCLAVYLNSGWCCLFVCFLVPCMACFLLSVNLDHPLIAFLKEKDYLV